MARRSRGILPGAAARGLMRSLEKVVRDGKAVPRGSRYVPLPRVKRLPSGRWPANSHLAGKQFPMHKLPPRLREKYPNGVRFTDDGFPDFSPYAKHTADFPPPGFAGNRTTDFTQANRYARPPIDVAPEGYTWHHHQDGHTMQLVPTDLHGAVRHAGGVALKKGG